MIRELNSDQLGGLAKLCFDLAKAGLLLSLLPSSTLSNNLILSILNIAVGLFIGLAFTYCALILLHLKHNVNL
ncbi:MAG: hypothetical protein A3F31_02075 [Candidatus Levybacteria bacterium RIFCSPHIGHO2_12_FULL_38_12]|nr:MAG: hypothetical protein A2770_04030 [Candidatus Levybacteria bacterium RIFCSPHIGHO2_01_FULL_38_12]OGH22248.1 MAG: hypothetical protein A3F31_02075 [Candidatus Levybacteria bacterium RIFCSPHIGHO2_12_FULL_38_12]OGH44272.1 MAG: hypothetical protein A3J14_05455 [Candidatus Levybacteria bacterium RIFCSPLOWO2_02_FULL_37_18]